MSSVSSGNISVNLTNWKTSDQYGSRTALRATIDADGKVTIQKISQNIFQRAFGLTSKQTIATYDPSVKEKSVDLKKLKKAELKVLYSLKDFVNESSVQDILQNFSSRLSKALYSAEKIASPILQKSSQGVQGHAHNPLTQRALAPKPASVAPQAKQEMEKQGNDTRKEADILLTKLETLVDEDSLKIYRPLLKANSEEILKDNIIMIRNIINKLEQPRKPETQYDPNLTGWDEEEQLSYDDWPDEVDDQSSTS